MSPVLSAFLITAGCAAVALGGLLVFRRFWPPAVLQPHREAVGVFTTIIATIYAVVLAFVVVIVWEEFDTVRSAVMREANGIVDLGRLAIEMPKPGGEHLHRELVNFAKQSVDGEWRTLERGLTHAETEQSMNALWRILARDVKAETPQQQEILHAAFDRLTEVSDSRRICFYASSSEVPLVMWVLLLGGAAINLGFTSFFAISSGRWHAVMTVLLAAEIGFVLFLIATLDNPFSRGAQLSPEPLHRAIRMLETFSS